MTLISTFRQNDDHKHDHSNRMSNIEYVVVNQSYAIFLEIKWQFDLSSKIENLSAHAALNTVHSSTYLQQYIYLQIDKTDDHKFAI